MSNSWAIGLYSYSSSHPEADGFKGFYESVLAIFKLVGITPTYFAVEGLGYKGGLTKYGGRTHGKVLRTGFSGIHVMSVVANPEGSDEPGYDSFASASLGYVEDAGETLLCLAMEDKFLGFGGDVFEKVLLSLVALRSWSFGYALSQPTAKKPEFHVLGLDGGDLGQEERRRLNAWYASLPEERLCKLRDIYPYVLLNEVQLAAKISATQTVADVAKSDSRSVLLRIDGGSLWLWKIQPDAVSDLRVKIADSGVLIT